MALDFAVDMWHLRPSYLLHLILLCMIASFVSCRNDADNFVHFLPSVAHHVIVKRGSNTNNASSLPLSAPKSSTASTTTVKMAEITTHSDATKLSSKNCSIAVNDSSCLHHTSNTGSGIIGHGVWSLAKENSTMLMRTFYVLVGIIGVVTLYMIVRAIRVRRRQSIRRRYGRLNTDEDSTELRHLQDPEDADDDTTLFDRTKHTPVK